MFCGFKPQMWNASVNETDVMNGERNAGTSHTWTYWLDLERRTGCCSRYGSAGVINKGPGRAADERQPASRPSERARRLGAHLQSTPVSVTRRVPSDYLMREHCPLLIPFCTRSEASSRRHG
ncbi:hypothetical protein EYF80_051049 [Liparis tanakae]|uniref:Uncharacterized protein n=1 Tax=Liparis tanakae TaxID=230148 RepID=A0A4Z2FEF6_9TELE|nr:hypothetical protein EYF80_051049 [Liparis tanakae]